MSEMSESHFFEKNSVNIELINKEKRKEELKRERKAERAEKRKLDEFEEIFDEIAGKIDRQNEKVDEEIDENVVKIEKRRKVRKLPQMPYVDPSIKWQRPPRNPEFFYHYSQLGDEAKKQMKEEYVIKLKVYEEKKAQYDQIRRKWLSDIIEIEKDIPYEERTKASLERELEFRGLETTGVRDVLLKRLKKHDDNPNDVTLIKNTMKVVEKITDVKLFSEHQPQIFGYGSGEYGIVGLPHGIISRLLNFFNVVCPDDYYSLFGLLTTCKYLQEDVVKYLTKESKRIFGEGGTPMALNCLFKTVWMKCKVFRTTQEIRQGVPKYKFEGKGKKLTVLKTQKKLGLVNWQRNLTPTQIDTMRMEISPIKMVQNGIKLCIQTYGSVEGYLNHLDKTRQVKINRENDKLEILEGAYKRANLFNKALNEMGYPDMIKCIGSGLSISCEHLEPQYWIGLVKHYDNSLKIVNYVKGYILREKPSLLKTVLVKFPVGFPEFVNRFKKISNIEFDMYNSYGRNKHLVQFMSKCMHLFLPNKVGESIKWFGQCITKELLDKHFDHFVRIDLNMTDQFGRAMSCDFFYNFSYYSRDNLYIVFDKDLSILPTFHVISQSENSRFDSAIDINILLTKLGLTSDQILVKDPVTGIYDQKRVVFAKKSF